MPKLGMEPLRRSALVDAAITEIGSVGSLDVTVVRIARRAGVSSALAHHYFGSKEQIFLAAMREILRRFGDEARVRLKTTRTPHERLAAIAGACFSPANFDDSVATAWMNFYALARINADAERLLSVYHRRLHSNLLHALKPLAGARAEDVAVSCGALIDGIYLRAILGREPIARTRATAMVIDHLEQAMGGSA